MNISPRARRPHASFLSLSGEPCTPRSAAHPCGLRILPCPLPHSPECYLFHLWGRGAGGLAGRQRFPWCGRGRPSTHNDQVRSGGCFSFGFVSCFFHQVCFVWGKEELTPPARLPLWVWYNLFCAQRITVDGSDGDSWLAAMLTALFLGPSERLQGRTDLMEGKYWLPGIR